VSLRQHLSSSVRYWPKWIPGDNIIEHFVGKDVGDVDAWQGVLDNIPFHVFAMKEPDYVMQLMSTYGTNERVGELKKRVYNSGGEHREKTFQYPKVGHNHFRYRHIVDDGNGKRHSPISLEVVWATKWWPRRVFAFILAITEVNVMLASVLFGGYRKTSMLDFRKRLSYELIYNTYEPQQDEEQLRRSPRSEATQTHSLRALPRGKKFLGSEMVSSDTPYPQKRCCGCQRKVRTYCKCSPGTIRCDDCFALHVLEAENDSANRD
jgi:hypothetical protein